MEVLELVPVLVLASTYWLRYFSKAFS
jgi:hypothetical protein